MKSARLSCENARSCANLTVCVNFTNGRARRCLRAGLEALPCVARHLKLAAPRERQGWLYFPPRIKSISSNMQSIFRQGWLYFLEGGCVFSSRLEGMRGEALTCCFCVHLVYI